MALRHDGFAVNTLGAGLGEGFVQGPSGVNLDHGTAIFFGGMNVAEVIHIVTSFGCGGLDGGSVAVAANQCVFAGGLTDGPAPVTATRAAVTTPLLTVTIAATPTMA